MTIRHLQIFKTVCGCGSITAAAKQLNMTQPAVSIAIKELEVFYHTQLFERINRHIYLTEAGTLLRGYADTVLDQFDEATSALRDGSAFRQCGLGANVSVAETTLSDILSVIKQRMPDIDLKVTVRNTKAVLENLQNNAIDFAIVDRSDTKGGYVSIPLYTDQMTAVCTKTYFPDPELSFAEFSRHTLLLREQGSGSRDCVDAAFAGHGCIAAATVESNSTLSLIEMTKNGLGFSILPSALAKKVCAADESLHTVAIPDISLRRDYYLLYHEKKHLTQTMQTVINILKNFWEN